VTQQLLLVAASGGDAVGKAAIVAERGYSRRRCSW